MAHHSSPWPENIQKAELFALGAIQFGVDGTTGGAPPRGRDRPCGRKLPRATGPLPGPPHSDFALAVPSGCRRRRTRPVALSRLGPDPGRERPYLGLVTGARSDGEEIARRRRDRRSEQGHQSFALEMGRDQQRVTERHAHALERRLDHHRVQPVARRPGKVRRAGLPGGEPVGPVVVPGEIVEQRPSMQVRRLLGSPPGMQEKPGCTPGPAFPRTAPRSARCAGPRRRMRSRRRTRVVRDRPRGDCRARSRTR